MFLWNNFNWSDRHVYALDREKKHWVFIQSVPFMNIWTAAKINMYFFIIKYFIYWSCIQLNSFVLSGKLLESYYSNELSFIKCVVEIFLCMDYDTLVTVMACGPLVLGISSSCSKLMKHRYITLIFVSWNASSQKYETDKGHQRVTVQALTSFSLRWGPY